MHDARVYNNMLQSFRAWQQNIIIECMDNNSPPRFEEEEEKEKLVEMKGAKKEH
jgi:hypothetical protein